MGSGPYGSAIGCHVTTTAEPIKKKQTARKGRAAAPIAKGGILAVEDLTPDGAPTLAQARPRARRLRPLDLRGSLRRERRRSPSRALPFLAPTWEATEPDRRHPWGHLAPNGANSSRKSPPMRVQIPLGTQLSRTVSMT